MAAGVQQFKVPIAIEVVESGYSKDKWPMVAKFVNGGVLAAKMALAF